MFDLLKQTVWILHAFISPVRALGGASDIANGISEFAHGVVLADE